MYGFVYETADAAHLLVRPLNEVELVCVEAAEEQVAAFGEMLGNGGGTEEPVLVRFDGETLVLEDMAAEGQHEILL